MTRGVFKAYVFFCMENHLVIAVLMYCDLKPHLFIDVFDGLNIFPAPRVLSSDVVDDHTMAKHLRVEYGVHTILFNETRNSLYPLSKGRRLKKMNLMMIIMQTE